MRECRLPRPGDISKVLEPGPWGLYDAIPSVDDVSVSNTYVYAADGLLLVLASVGQ